MNVFDQENNSGSRINPDSQINPDNQIIYPIQINSPIQPTFNIPLTWPTDFELLTRPAEFSEENEKEYVPDDPYTEPSSSDS